MEFALLADKAAQQVSVFLLHGPLVPERGVLHAGASFWEPGFEVLISVSTIYHLCMETVCAHLFWVSAPELFMLLRPLVTETDWVLVCSPGIAEVK